MAKSYKIWWFLTGRFLVLNSCKWHGQEQSQFYKTRQDEMW